jgi:hypothetical protein
MLATIIMKNMAIRKTGVDKMMGRFRNSDMTQRDLDNLEFLLTASTEVIGDWFSKMEPDDIDYAFELLEMAKLELVDQATELTDLSEANDALSKIMEKR